MLTRQKQSHTISLESFTKRQRLRAVIVGLSAGMLIGVAGEAIADGEMQLRPPLNSTLTIRSSETSWTARPTTPNNSGPTVSSPQSLTSPAPAKPAVAADLTPALEREHQATSGGQAAAIDDPTAKVSVDAKSNPADPAENSSGKDIQAIPASSPLDRFRGPLAKLPSMKLDAPTTKSQLGEPSVPTPGEQVLDRLATPALPSGSAWQGRAVGQRTDSFEAVTTEEIELAPDGFRRPVTEGNWVARDAINRIAPLQDPGDTFQPSASGRVAAPLHAQQQPSRVAGPIDPPAQTLIGPNAAELSKSIDHSMESTVPATSREKSSGDGFVNRSHSMSLSEAQAAATSTQNTDVKSREQNAEDAPPRLEQPQTALQLNKADTDDSKADASSNAPSKLGQPSIQNSDHSREVAKRTDAAAKPIKEESSRPAVNSALTPLPDSAEPLPKRQPLKNLTDADLSSTRREVASPLQRMPDFEEPATELKPVGEQDRKPASEPASEQDTEPAPTSVGDLEPTENQVLDYTGNPASEIRPTRVVASFRGGIERALRYFYDRPEVASGRSNWGMMHSLMVYGADTQLIVGNQKYSAIAWIAGNNNCRGQRLLTHDANGIQAKSGVGLQGHQGQFLAVLGMCNVPTSYPLHAGKMKYDVAALIEAEKRACKAGEELTFTLIGLSHYLDTDSTWIADDGTEWDFERLIAEELKQPIVGAACGGTHRLMGYSHALRKRRAEGKPITGHWKRAETYTEDFIKYAYSLQNRDGSMSTDWFEGRADDGNVDRKIQTTGHIVEWLLTVTPDDQLQDQRLVAAISFLLRSVGSDLDHDWSIGPKGHALRSLAMYHQRVFRSGTPWIPTSLARTNQSQHR
ncbi:MAG: hypothetical protein KDB00_07695 [Planctomycetales bacterium]|nr:hypothetical protein [Planctomycetales bacterium]